MDDLRRQQSSVYKSLAYCISGNVQYFTFDNTKTEVTSLALSFYSGLFAYNGWWVEFIVWHIDIDIYRIVFFYRA